MIAADLFVTGIKTVALAWIKSVISKVSSNAEPDSRKDIIAFNLKDFGLVKEPIKMTISKGKVFKIEGGQEAKRFEEFLKSFNDPETYRVAELGIGCNPKAVVTGNVLEDEKVGLHIAYGHSTHLGGKVKSDIHIDIVHAKGCPVEGTTLTLINSDGSKFELIRDSMLRYDLLK